MKIIYRPVMCIDGVARIECVVESDEDIVISFCGSCVDMEQAEEMAHRLTVKATGSELLFG